MSGILIPLAGAALRLHEGRMKRSPTSRFWSKVVRDPSGCWLWIGAIATDTGYGIFYAGDDVRMGAHVFAFELANPGADRTGLVVRHTCDTPNCVNPQHLKLGTHADNMKDMDDRGRRVSNPVRGEAHHNAKLTRDLVLRAREMHRRGAKVVDLARMFGVAPTTMAAALEGKTWRK